MLNGLKYKIISSSLDDDIIIFQKAYYNYISNSIIVLIPRIVVKHIATLLQTTIGPNFHTLVIKNKNISLISLQNDIQHLTFLLNLFFFAVYRNSFILKQKNAFTKYKIKNEKESTKFKFFISSIIFDL